MPSSDWIAAPKRTADFCGAVPGPDRSRAEPGFGIPDREPGELVEWVGRATRTQGARVVGGRLLVTDRRLVFRPGLLDSMTGGRTWCLYLSEIYEATTDLHPPVPGSRFHAGRLRLKVVARDGEAIYFTVAQLEDLLERLRRGRGW